MDLIGYMVLLLPVHISNLYIPDNIKDKIFISLEHCIAAVLEDA